jgi:Cu+-exporting ATPase
MACCILTAFVMNRLIKACDTFDFRFLQIKYNDDEGDACAPAEKEEKTTSETCRISIGGMTCGACVSSVTKHLESVEGVFRASVSLALGRATVSYDTVLTIPDQILKAIRDAGYDADLSSKSVEEIIERLRQNHELRDLRAAISSASVCSMLIIGLDYVPSFTLMSMSSTVSWRLLAWISLLLASRVQIWDAWSIHSRAWAKRGKREATMDTLLSLSLLLGLGLPFLQAMVGNSQDTYTYASSGSFLTIVILAGKYLEAVLKRESNSNLATLYELQTERDTYRLTGSTITVSASLLKKGDDILLSPQATIPCDCFIIEGCSAINESSITGEALPVVKDVGDFILAGTQNLSRQLRVIVSQDQSESSLAKVIEGVSTATEQRLEGAEPLDVVMNYFVSGVICLAAAAFVLTLSRDRSLPLVECFTAACERAATVLAAACPCGIGLSTPSAAMAGIGEYSFLSHVCYP